MNTTFITRAYGAAKLALKAHAPTLMVAGGVVTMGAAAVVGAKQTLKMEEVLAKHVPDLEKIKQARSLNVPSYGDDAAFKDTVALYTRVGLDLTKLYAVPAVMFAGGAGLVFGGHRIMLKRNATLAVAFTSLKQAYDAYRSRVVQQFGSETDQAMAHGYVTKEVIDPETGEVATVRSRDWNNENDPYNRIFEEGASSQWVPDLGVNKMFVSQQQRMANILLSKQGFLYLNDVYEALGFPKNDIGQVTGWKVRELPDGSRDIPFVDFGLDKPHPDDWKYNKENAIYLDFNCQGLIVGGRVQKLLEKA